MPRLPAVTTRWAEPVPAGMTARHDLVWSQTILGCVPVLCHSWGHGQQRVVLAQTVVGAKRALTVPNLPSGNSRHPFVQKPTGTLVTAPPHTQDTTACDLPVCQLVIFGMMPLPLLSRLMLGLLTTVAESGYCRTVLSILVPKSSKTRLLHLEWRLCSRFK